MSTPEIQIVKLAPARVASAWGFGSTPEETASAKLFGWAAAQGLLGDGERRRIFGFNNPSPSAGSPNYGYEFWITVDASVEPQGDIRTLDFPGGLYAVMPFDMGAGDPYETIPAAWRQLDAWVAERAHRPGQHQWLEEHSTEGKLIALYYPIAE